MSHCVASAVLITGRIKKVRTDLVNIKISWNYYTWLTVKKTVRVTHAGSRAGMNINCLRSATPTKSEKSAGTSLIINRQAPIY